MPFRPGYSAGPANAFSSASTAQNFNHRRNGLRINQDMAPPRKRMLDEELIEAVFERILGYPEGFGGDMDADDTFQTCMPNGQGGFTCQDMVITSGCENCSSCGCG